MPLGRYLLIAAAAVGPAMPLPAQQARELTGDQQVIHVLNRLAFGPRPGDVQRVRAVGVDAWIAQQLTPERINDTPIETFVAQYRLLNTDQNELLKQFASLRQQRQAVQRDSAK